MDGEGSAEIGVGFEFPEERKRALEHLQAIKARQPASEFSSPHSAWMRLTCLDIARLYLSLHP